MALTPDELCRMKQIMDDTLGLDDEAEVDEVYAKLLKEEGLDEDE